LYGEIRRGYTDYDHATGVNIDVREPFTVRDLLLHFHVKDLDRAVVLRQGGVLNMDDRLTEGKPIVLLESMIGG
jgi:hypothetical protein